MAKRDREVLERVFGGWCNRLRNTPPEILFGTDEYGYFGNVTVRVSGRDICEAVAAIEGVNVQDIIRHTDAWCKRDV
jgi:hypothetical protein